MTIRSSDSSKPTLNHRPPTIFIKQDFHELGIKFSFVSTTLRHLKGYSNDQYNSLMTLLKSAQKITKFNRVLIDPPKKISADDSINILKDEQRAEKFLLTRIRGNTLDLRELRLTWAVFQKEEERSPIAPSHKISPSSVPVKSVTRPEILKPRAREILTPDRLLNPKALNPEHPYPETLEEYNETLHFITGNGKFGKFPGDEEALSHLEYFWSPKLRREGVRTYFFNRGGYDFTAVVFNPKLHARQFKNRLIFDGDLVSQAATYGAIKKVGCSYDRTSYYEDRLFTSDSVAFIYYEGMPVSFAAVTNYKTKFADRHLSYAFIHFVMTLGKFQGMGLTSYIVREILSSMYYHNIWRQIWWRQGKNLFIDKKGNLKNQVFTMWVLCHTGRIPAAHQFLTSFKVFDPRIEQSQEIVETVVKDADQKISGDRGERQLYPVAPYAWCDEGAYPPKNRYLVGPDKEVDIPKREQRLSTYPIVMGILGGTGSKNDKKKIKSGKEGLKNGNSGYFVGLLNLGRIEAAKRKERQKRGGGPLEQFGDSIRGRILKRVR